MDFFILCQPHVPHQRLGDGELRGVSCVPRLRQEVAGVGVSPTLPRAPGSMKLVALQPLHVPIYSL